MGSVRPSWVGRRCGSSAVGLFILLSLLPSQNSATASLGPENEECTIAVVSGRATVDGRPLLWKNRDTGFLDNEVVYFDDGAYPYVALVNAGESYRAWIGLNDQGFAVLNALSYNIPDSINYGITNGELMKWALQVCATVDDFELLLEQTSKTGRQNPANLAVLDAAGGAAMFEVGNRSWRRFDAKDPKVAPEGFIVRTNFSFSADTSASDTYRYHRCRRLLERAVRTNDLGVRTLVQDVARDIRSEKVDPYPLPYDGSPPGHPDAVGYVDADNTINRRTTAASGVIQGVLLGEDPLFSSFFATVGQPILSIALPVWVAAGATPVELDGPETSPICDLAVQRMIATYDYPYDATLLNTYRLLGEDRTSFLALAQRVERWLFPLVENRMSTWRTDGADATAMAAFQRSIASDAFAAYQGGSLPPPVLPVSLRTGPNPTRGVTSIRYEADGSPPPGWTIDVIDARGRRIRRLETSGGTSRSGTITWDGRDGTGVEVAAGVYFLRPSWTTGSRGSSIVVLPH